MCLLPHGKLLQGLLVESAQVWAWSLVLSNLLGEGLPAQAWGIPGTQESWQCQPWPHGAS